MEYHIFLEQFIFLIWPKLSKGPLFFWRKKSELDEKLAFLFDTLNKTPGYHQDVFRPATLFRMLYRKMKALFLEKNFHSIF